MNSTVEHDARQVVAAVEAMTSAFHDHHLPGILACYAPDAAVAFEPGAPVSGEAALAEGFKAFFAVSPRFTYAAHDVLVAGHLALHIAPWTMTGTAPDGTTIAQQGLSVSVLQRDAQGAWKLALDNPHGDRLLPGHRR